jgi:hypothetical protein
MGVGRVNGGDEGEGTWLMFFIYIYNIQNRTTKSLVIALSRAQEEVMGRRWWRESNQSTI